MNLFINDIPVRILLPEERPEPGHFNVEINASTEPINKAKLLHHVWLNKASVQDMDLVFDLINSKVPINLLSLTVSINDYEAFKQYLKGKFNEKFIRLIIKNNTF